MKQEFGLPHLIRFPILPELSAAGDGEIPNVQLPRDFRAACFLEWRAGAMRKVPLGAYAGFPMSDRA